MATKTYDLCVKTGEYTGRDGNQKANWLKVGALFHGEGDTGPYLLLDRTFNPAGLPNPDNRSNVLVSLFVPKQKEEGPQQSGGYYDKARQVPTATAAPVDEMEDEIPF